MAHILLVDDDQSMLGFLDGALSKAGHLVTTAENGTDALSLIQENDHYDLLLTDIVMPGIDGIELSRKATHCRPKLKVMFITGFSAVALNDGVHKKAPLMAKPFHLNDLVHKVDEVLKA